MAWAFLDDQQQVDLEREQQALRELRGGLVMPDSKDKVAYQVRVTERHLARIGPDGEQG
jgi:hypothetical protein